MAIPRGLLHFLQIVLALGFILIYLRYTERRVIFYPMRNLEYFPTALGLNFDDVYLKTGDDVDINAWLVPFDNAKYTILFCHGNAGNISHRVEKLKFFHDIGCSVLIFDYRGYGRSKGRPSEDGVYYDAKSAYDYLIKKGIPPERIIGYGESIGGAVIIDLASKNKLKALIIDSTFSSAKDMIKVIYPFLPYWVFSSRLDSIAKIKSISVPKLIIHSINDEIVPYKLGQKLYNEAGYPKEFLEIHGGHNSCFYESEGVLKEKISDFLKRL